MTAGMRERGLSGQASVEFTAIAFVFFFTLAFILWAGFVMYERASVSSHLGTLGTELPSNWRQMSGEELVKDLLSADGVLKRDNIEVLEVKLDSQPGTEKVSEPNAVAQALGGTKNTVRTSTLGITAKVRYTYAPPLSMGGSVSMEAAVTRTYMTGQLNEYS